MKLSNRVAAGGVMVAASLALLVATLPSVDEDKAYAWVDTDGGTCETYDPPGEYVDEEACGTFQDAWEAVGPGHTVRVKAGTYPPQDDVGGQKFAPVRIVGEDGTVIDTDTAHNSGLGLVGMVTVDNVDVEGDTPFVFLGGQRSGWVNATFHEGATGMNARSCANNDAQPILIYADADSPTVRNATLQNITIEEQHHRDPQDDTCGEGDLYHLELLRIDQNVDGVLIDSVFFSGCADCGSGLVFITAPSSTGAVPRRLVIRNSIFEASTTYSFQMSTNVATCEGYVFAYNTFAQDVSLGCDTEADVRWIGNLGPRPLSAPCKGTYTRNVWQRESFQFAWFKCGPSDTIIEGPNFSTSELGLDENWKLEPGSPAIDRGETPSFDDYCTGPLAGDDIDGDPRPVGEACDAGSDEWQG